MKESLLRRSAQVVRAILKPNDLYSEIQGGNTPDPGKQWKQWKTEQALEPGESFSQNGVFVYHSQQFGILRERCSTPPTDTDKIRQRQLDMEHRVEHKVNKKALKDERDFLIARGQGTSWFLTKIRTPEEEKRLNQVCQTLASPPYAKPSKPQEPYSDPTAGMTDAERKTWEDGWPDIQPTNHLLDPNGVFETQSGYDWKGFRKANDRMEAERASGIIRPTLRRGFWD